MVFIDRSKTYTMNRQIIESATAVLEQITGMLSMLNDAEYAAWLPVLSGASLGEHVRHVIEFFQELETGYRTGIVDYDARKREKALETRREVALLKLHQLAAGLQAENRSLQLAFKVMPAGTMHPVETSYERELLHNLDHAVHHMALMKVGISALKVGGLPQHFGIAAATIEYRRAQCAQ